MGRQRNPGEAKSADLRRARLRARRKGTAGERAKAAFLSVISHELRTPLNTILGQTDLLAGDSLHPHTREAVEAIRDAGHGLNAILNDLFLLAKLESGHEPEEQAEFDIHAIAEGVQRLCRPKAWAQKLDLELVIDHQVPRRLVGDAGRIRQTLVNLTGNALKFTERGGVSISVEMSNDDNTLKISVADTGIGIAAEDRRRLFAPFEQGDRVLTRRYGGLGLGLALCKRLVASMGGRIGVESRPGIGSTFWFTAPVIGAVPAQVDRDRPAALLLDNQTLVRVKGLRVLVADDNAIHRDLLARLFENASISAVFVHDGLEAVAAAGSEAFDAIVLDAHMPLAGGMQAARMIRALQRQSRSIVLIACAAGDASEAECASFCDGVVRKPYEARAVLDALAAGRQANNGDAPFDTAPMEELERAVGRDVLVDILKSFLSAAADMTHRIEEAASLSDHDGMERMARDLAGAASGLGLNVLTTAARALSTAARLGSQNLTEQARGLAGLGEDTRKRMVSLYPDLVG